MPVDPDTWQMRTRGLTDSFLRFFTARGLESVAPVAVTSGVDPSVRFVGSTISVLKPHIAEPPRPGLCLAQPAMRTQNLARLITDPEPLEWSSTFLALGTLSPPDQLGWTLEQARTWLTESVGADAEDLMIRADSRDEDLIAAVLGSGWPQLELDGYEARRYRHRFGLEGIGGRNVNLAVRRGDRLDDIANVILIEADGAPVAVEFAIGVSACLARLDGLDHPLQASPVADVLPTSTERQRRLADAVAAIALLTGEGLRPVSRGRGGILRRYLHAVGALLPDDTSLEVAGEAASWLAGDQAVGNELVRQVERLSTPGTRLAPAV